MSDDFEDLFLTLPALPRGTKRTYDIRRQAFNSNETGLATPPASSSPPMSPVAHTKIANRFGGRREEHQSVPTARSITALLERSCNALPAKAKRCKINVSKDKKQLVQMHLNLLPAHITCKDCGMSYTRTSASDTAMHTAFHSSHLQGLPISSTLSLVDGIHRLSMTKTSERNMMLKCAELVDLELSASLAPLDSSFQGYIMVDTGRVRSFLLVQAIKSAKVLDRGTGEESTEVPAIMGVSRMWTARRSRGQGKIRELIERARRDFVHGCVLAKSEVAFTQLSESGLQTVQKWRAGESILVYRD